MMRLTELLKRTLHPLPRFQLLRDPQVDLAVLLGNPHAAEMGLVARKFYLEGCSPSRDRCCSGCAGAAPLWSAWPRGWLRPKCRLDRRYRFKLEGGDDITAYGLVDGHVAELAGRKGPSLGCVS